MELDPLTTILVSAAVGSVFGVIANAFTLKHRLQAENEYTILMKIWNRAYWLKSRANSLRPKHDSGNPNAEKQKRLDAFDKAKREFDEEMYLNKPFYPDDIYRCLRGLGNNAAFEAIDYHHGTATAEDQQYWAESDASAEKINRLVDQLCDAIRCRIHGRIVYRGRQTAGWLWSLLPRWSKPAA